MVSSRDRFPGVCPQRKRGRSGPDDRVQDLKKALHGAGPSFPNGIDNVL
jgi:hypothetical protein